MVLGLAVLVGFDVTRIQSLPERSLRAPTISFFLLGVLTNKEYRHPRLLETGQLSANTVEFRWVVHRASLYSQNKTRGKREKGQRCQW